MGATVWCWYPGVCRCWVLGYTLANVQPSYFRFLQEDFDKRVENRLTAYKFNQKNKDCIPKIAHWRYVSTGKFWKFYTHMTCASLATLLFFKAQAVSSHLQLSSEHNAQLPRRILSLSLEKSNTTV
jgi:hypothetical protein